MPDPNPCLEPYEDGCVCTEPHGHRHDHIARANGQAVHQWPRILVFDPAGDHVYLSTGCLHDEHEYCKAMVGYAGEKRPGRCKFCGAQCVCPCHRADEAEPAGKDSADRRDAEMEGERKTSAVLKAHLVSEQARLRGHIQQLRAQRDAVLALHPREVCGERIVCGWCRQSDESEWPWPCPTAAALGAPCCDLHGRTCEPPSELCCRECTEGAHPQHADGSTCSNPDLSAEAR